MTPKGHSEFERNPSSRCKVVTRRRFRHPSRDAARGTCHASRSLEWICIGLVQNWKDGAAQQRRRLVNRTYLSTSSREICKLLKSVTGSYRAGWVGLGWVGSGRVGLRILRFLPQPRKNSARASRSTSESALVWNTTKTIVCTGLESVADREPLSGRAWFVQRRPSPTRESARLWPHIHEQKNSKVSNG